MTAVGVGELTSIKVAASGDCSSSAAVWLPAAGCGSGAQQSACLGPSTKAAPVEIASTKHVTVLTTAANSQLAHPSTRAFDRQPGCRTHSPTTCWSPAGSRWRSHLQLQAPLSRWCLRRGTVQRGLAPFAQHRWRGIAQHTMQAVTSCTCALCCLKHMLLHIAPQLQRVPPTHLCTTRCRWRPGRMPSWWPSAPPQPRAAGLQALELVCT